MNEFVVENSEKKIVSSFLFPSSFFFLSFFP